ncbi:glyceraldehyde-3-phosphate dehydrogenase [Vibrio inusitatus NBRC 102082]|uniref:Glyceraldehyde-3-phosphate dehydrogenase n=2 Tax=Vibrio inusitatus TaxID=413402 RepID=A0A4Y3HZ27_9VIBR|nr:glyceraldehyde-3-phosphate dehydrogenase [Vibrio inusitatus NBRC 102082]
MLLTSVCGHALATSYTDPIDNKFDMGDYLAENAYGFLPVPILITEPALGYGGGMMGIFLHESNAQKKKRKQLAMESLDGGAQLLTPAITAVGAFGTENGSWGAFVGHRHTWNKDSIRYLGGAFYGDIHMNFYSPYEKLDSSGFEMSMQGAGVMQKLQFRVAGTPLFLGVTQKFVSPDLAIMDKDHVEDVISSRLNMSPSVSGLGVVAEFDTRNSFFYPTAGGDYKAQYMVFDEAIGSDYNFQTVNAEGVHYFSLSDTWNIAVQGKYNSLFTDERLLPPPAYPDIELRGIARNRYQGNAAASIESQLTYNISTRWSTSIFGGLGSATDESSDLFSSENHYAYGVGFRYLIARRYGLHAGIDIAKSEEDNALYFQVGTGL